MTRPWPDEASPDVIGVASNGTDSLTWTVPAGALFSLEGVYAEIDAGSFPVVPTLVVRNQDGQVITRKAQTDAIDLLLSGSASWALRLSDDGAGLAGLRWGENDEATQAPVADGLTLVGSGGDWLFDTDNGDFVTNTGGGPYTVQTEGAVATIDAGVDGEVILTASELVGGTDAGVIQLNNGNSLLRISKTLSRTQSASILLQLIAQGGGAGVSFIVNSSSNNLNLLTITNGGTTTFRFVSAASSLVIQDNTGAPIFRVDNNGALHGKTGKALTFDL